MKTTGTSPISRFLPRSLRARLVLLVCIAVGPALGLILYTDRDQRLMAENHARENLVQLSKVVNDEHRLLIEGTRQLLTVLASLPAVKDQNAAACSATMKAVIKDFPQYAGLGAVKPNGEWFCGASLAGAGSIKISDRLWFQRSLKTREFTIGNYQIGPGARSAVVPLAYPSVDEHGNIRVVVLAVVDLEWLKGMVARSVLPPGSTMMIVDNKGLILARHPGNGRWIGQSIAGTPLDKALRSGRVGLHSVEGPDHIRRFAVFSSLSGDDASGSMHLILSTHHDRVFAEAHRILRRNLFWLTLVSLAVLAAAWFGGEVFIVRQVASLLVAAQRIAKGDLKARTGVSYTSGELGQLAKSFDDMADSLEARQEETRRAEASARENERLAAMGATAAGITHEIANPLTGMYSTVQFLEQQLAKPRELNFDTLKSDVKTLKDEIERLIALLHDLRHFVRSGQLNLKPVSLAEIAAGVLAMELHDYKKRGIETELNFPPSLPRVMADREKLKQVLLNLCKNAAEAMPEGGRLSLGAFQNDQEVILEVKDTGYGIPTEVNAFELFITTKPQGTGLGLAIVRQIIAAHGGVVSYTSKPRSGTAFRITMPLAPPAEFL